MKGDEDEYEIGDLKMHDRLLTSLCRNDGGHLSSVRGRHEVDKSHNCAVLYFYVDVEENEWGIRRALQSIHLFSWMKQSYKQWKKVVDKEVLGIESHPDNSGMQFYGWLTKRLKVSYLRTGDLMIVVDEHGPRFHQLHFLKKTAESNARIPSYYPPISRESNHE